MIYDVALNDVSLVVKDGVKMPSYAYWHSMIKRCYDPKEHRNYPTYIGCTVHEPWLKHSNFKEWFECQDWVGKQLDKDLLKPGNKHYSPDTCIFLRPIVNGFLTERSRFKSEYGTGISKLPSGNYRAVCNNPYINDRSVSKTFTTLSDAIEYRRSMKHEFALMLASEETDARIIEALTKRFSKNE